MVRAGSGARVGDPPRHRDALPPPEEDGTRRLAGVGAGGPGCSPGAPDLPADQRGAERAETVARVAGYPHAGTALGVPGQALPLAAPRPLSGVGARRRTTRAMSSLGGVADPGGRGARQRRTGIL